MNINKIKVLRGPGLKSLDRNLKTVMGSITVKALSTKGHIPYYEEGKGGYQRRPNSSRVNEIARRLEAGEVDFPTAILISFREEPEDLLHGDGNNQTLNLASAKFNIVDGQHRYLALKKVLEENEKFSPHYKIPFVAILGADERTEVEQFLTVNSTAKPVPTDLAEAHLRNLAMLPGGERVMENLIRSGKEWKVQGRVLMEMMCKVSEFWEARVRMPNADKAKTTVPSTSMVASFQPILKESRFFASIQSTEQQAQILDAYWRGIQTVLPEPFANPSNYSLHKGLGVRTLHGIFPDVWKSSGHGNSLISPTIRMLLFCKAL